MDIDTTYLSYECSICGSKLICEKEAWDYHLRVYPDSQAYCNGEIQKHIVNDEDNKYFYSFGNHPPTLMVKIDNEYKLYN